MRGCLYNIHSLVWAANDWTKPCLRGVCFYDLPASSRVSGTLQISGPPNAISDITTAAGWVILGCDPNASAQEIRLVCQTDDSVTAGCDHLHQNASAINKLVRLPENCGRGAFARVANAWIPEDQSIPSSIAARIIRRDGSQPQVHALTLDTNFSAIDREPDSSISFVIRGSNIQGFSSNGTITPPTPQRHSRATRREIDNVSKSLISVDNATAPYSFNFSGNSMVLNETIPCGSDEASIMGNINATGNGVLEIRIVASGSITDLSLDQFELTANLNANFTGILHVVGSVAGTLDTEPITFAQIGIPGLEIPDILTIGPSLVLNAAATLTLDLGVDLTVNMAYQVKDANLVLPSVNTSNGSFTSTGTSLKLSVPPSVQSSGTITAHLIPTLEIGFNAFGKKVEAIAFLAFDASASLQMITPSNSTSHIARNDDRRDSIISISEARDLAKRASHNDSIQGCFDVATALNVSVGVEGSFFKIFEEGTSVNLFSQNYPLYDKCFGDTNSKEEVPQFDPRGGALLRRDLSCPTTIVTKFVPVAGEKSSGGNRVLGKANGSHILIVCFLFYFLGLM